MIYEMINRESNVLSHAILLFHQILLQLLKVQFSISRLEE